MKRTLGILIVSILLVAAVSVTWWYGARQSPDLAPGGGTNTSDSATDTPEGQAPEADSTDPAVAEQPLSYTSPKGVTIKLDQSITGSALVSPLTIRGQIPGNWSFEASFPVEVRGADGSLLAQQPAQLQADWMTENYVPFEVTLSFDAGSQKTGTIIFRKDNPSGLPENDDNITVSVLFQ